VTKKADEDEEISPIQRFLGVGFKQDKHIMCFQNLDSRLMSYRLGLRKVDCSLGALRSQQSVTPSTIPSQPSAASYPLSIIPIPKTYSHMNRVFVLNFEGDKYANQVQHLREEITAGYHVFAIFLNKCIHY